MHRGWLCCLGLLTCVLPLRAQQCTEVPLQAAFCRSLKFTKMALPNLNDDKSANEVLFSIRDWQDHLGKLSNCHQHLAEFLCNVYTPTCLDNSTLSGLKVMVVPPCRSFCEDVEGFCKKMAISTTNIGWPHAFRCSRFPQSGPCSQPSGFIPKSVTHKPVYSRRCRYCTQLAGISLKMHYCFANVVLRGTLGPNGTFLPINRKLNDSLILGNDTAVQTLKTLNDSSSYWEVDNLCSCVSERRMNDKTEYFLAADMVHGNLSASLLIAIDNLNSRQKKELEEIRSRPNCVQPDQKQLRSREKPPKKRRNKTAQRVVTTEKVVRRLREQKPQITLTTAKLTTVSLRRKQRTTNRPKMQGNTV